MGNCCDKFKNKNYKVIENNFSICRISKENEISPCPYPFSAKKVIITLVCHHRCHGFEFEEEDSISL
jgi:hypothetical protein